MACWMGLHFLFCEVVNDLAYLQNNTVYNSEMLLHWFNATYAPEAFHSILPPDFDGGAHHPMKIPPKD